MELEWGEEDDAAPVVEVVVGSVKRARGADVVVAAVAAAVSYMSQGTSK